MQKSFRFFKTRIDTLSRHEFFTEIDTVLKKQSASYHIVTLNPEILLRSHNNPLYRAIINASNRTVCDGTGLHLIFWKMRQRMRARITGVEILHYLLHSASKKNIRVACVCAEEGLTHFKTLHSALLEKYPTLFLDGFTVSCKQDITELSVKHIKILQQARIIICNFGAPYQEQFLSELLHKHIAIHAVALGVGGGFDFLSGAQKRAPLWMQKRGLEWLWRFITQPQRIGRIVNALFVFPWQVYRFNKQDKSKILHKNKKGLQ